MSSKVEIKSLVDRVLCPVDSTFFGAKAGSLFQNVVIAAIIFAAL
jgi:hypothetical protein